jgi:hypothetical protein
MSICGSDGGCPYRHTPREMLNASFRVLALTPSYIGNVLAYAIPLGLSRWPSSTPRAGLARYGKTRPPRRKRRALTTLTTGQAVVA